LVCAEEENYSEGVVALSPPPTPPAPSNKDQPFSQELLQYADRLEERSERRRQLSTSGQEDRLSTCTEASLQDLKEDDLSDYADAVSVIQEEPFQGFDYDAGEDLDMIIST